jgi:polar amino acid transport system substrate-binding protein
MKNHGVFKPFLIAVAVAAGALFGAPASSAETLRVCADPDNLPFSKSDGPVRGIYLELAELVGKRIGMNIEYAWWLTYNQRKALRNTILQDGCDAYFALPAGGDYRARGLQKSAAFLDVGYAVIAAPNFSFQKLSDLQGKRVAVQFGSTPQLVMSTREGYTMSTFREAHEGMDALAKAEVDAAFLWGPVAGFDNLQRFQGKYKVSGVQGLDLNGQVAIAVPSGKDELLAKINKALIELKPEITGLAIKYGFPQGQGVALAASKPPVVTSLMVNPAYWVNTQSTPSAVNQSKPNATSVKPKKEAHKAEAKPVEAAAPPPLSESAKLGRVRFNDQCSHCHSVDGASPISERNLRRLQARYDAKWKDMALTTIKAGRPDAGMPPWKEVFGEKEISELMSFIETIQR